MKKIMKEESLVQMLMEKNLTIATAESCTGGLVAATIVNVSGASEVFHEGYVTYSNESKIKNLNVDRQVLERVGAVSEEVAAAMADGCAQRAKTDIAVSTTGIAGPLGGTEEKPVGLVYIGCFICGNVYVEKNIFDGDRTAIRNKAAERAIEIVLEHI